MLIKKYSHGSSASSFGSGRTDSLNSLLDLYTSRMGLEDPIGYYHKCFKSSFVPPSGTSNSGNSSSELVADAGNGFGQALNLGTLNGNRTLSDAVSSTDLYDSYRFNLNTVSNLNIVVDGLSADANLQLFNSHGTLIGDSSQLGTLAESISLSAINPGTYYVQVSQYSGSTTYNLSLSSTANPPLTEQTGSTNSPIPPSSPSASSSPFTSFSLVDASGDSTANTVFQGGAIRLSYNYQNVASPLNIRLEALSNGSLVSTFELGNSISLSNSLINFASVSTLTAGDYQFRLVATTSSGQDAVSNTQLLKILTNSRINGTFAADTLEYSSGLGTGTIFLGRGGTDTLDLSFSSINSSNITSINGLSLATFNPLSGSTMNQAIYGGKAFDYMTLSDGREIYFQGIEYLRFTDGTTLELQIRPNDTFFSSQWNLSVSDVPSAWRFTQGASNVLLVSLDTGILTAVGASGGIVDINTSRLITEPSADDNYNNYGHGHSSISIMSSTANNNSGIAGINWNSSVNVKDVYYGVSLQQAIKDAISYARANNMKVVFQGGIQSDYWLTSGGTQAQLEQLIKDNSDIAMFAIAAGNGGTTGNLNTVGQDVNGVAKLQTTHNNVISVGALQRTGTATVNNMTNATAVDLATYSNRGADLTLVAATDSPAMDKFGNMNFFTGTSAANPNVAGIASLIWSVNPTLTAAQVRQILVETAMDLGTTGRDNTFGSGLVNADAAVRRAVALQRNSEVANLYAGSSFV